MTLKPKGRPAMDDTIQATNEELASGLPLYEIKGSTKASYFEIILPRDEGSFTMGPTVDGVWAKMEGPGEIHLNRTNLNGKNPGTPIPEVSFVVFIETAKKAVQLTFKSGAEGPVTLVSPVDQVNHNGPTGAVMKYILSLQHASSV
jgi:hypothetical protein